jgi:kynurenine formamidase
MYADLRSWNVELQMNIAIVGGGLKKRVKVVSPDTQADSHALATSISPHRTGPLLPHPPKEYLKWSGGRTGDENFPVWETEHRKLFAKEILGTANVGGDLNAATSKRVTFAWNSDRATGCIMRLVAIADPGGAYRIEPGASL